MTRHYQGNQGRAYRGSQAYSQAPKIATRQVQGHPAGGSAAEYRVEYDDLRRQVPCGERGPSSAAISQGGILGPGGGDVPQGVFAYVLVVSEELEYFFVCFSLVGHVLTDFVS